MIYHVTCNTDDNYAQHCCAMLCSLFENNKDMEFHVHILTHGLSGQNTKEIHKLCKLYYSQYTIYEVDETRLEGVKFRKIRPLTKAAYYRILLPEILDDSIDRVLYLDCDMIVLGSVEELFELELNDYALAATLDCMPYNSFHRSQLQMEVNERSFCSGIMMINLKYWREHSSVKRLLEFSKRERTPVYLHDQDSLNYVFKKHWYLLPPKWNKPSLSYLPSVVGVAHFDIYEYVYEPKIIHYSSAAKPWFNIHIPYSKQYRSYLNLSGYSHPQYEEIPIKKRMGLYLLVVKYYIRKYIMPFMPSMLLLLANDIHKILQILLIITNKERRRNYMLKEGLKNLKL